MFYQVYTAIACSYGSLLMGLLNVWPSYTLGLYTSSNITVLSTPMTELESSLLGSIPSLGAMLGTALVSPVIDKLGRKKGGIVITLPVVISWTLIEMSSTSMFVLIARFLGGVSGGASLVFAPIFISEIAEDSIRGTLASTPIALYCLGALASYLLGWFSTYHFIIWVNLACSILGVVLIGLVAESPVFLLKQNREEDARASLALYRGCSPASKIVLQELSRLKSQLSPAVELITVTGPDAEQKADEAEKEKLQADNEKITSEETQMPAWKLLFISPSSNRAFKVVAITLTLQVFMGMVPVQVYAKALFAEAAPNLSSHLCSVLFAVVLLSGSLLAAGIADKAGRRVLLITSSILVALCMGSLGFLLQTGLAPAWCSALVVLMFCFSFNMGAGSVPYIFLAEVFKSEVQGFASMLLVEWVWFLNFFIIAVFPFLAKFLGIYGVFYIFACNGVINAIVSYFMVPETKGLSNQQIQESFLRRPKK